MLSRLEFGQRYVLNGGYFCQIWSNFAQLYCTKGDIYASTVSNLLFAADGSENVTGLDLSDFPALADRSRREGTGNPTPVLNPLAGRAPYGRPLVMRKCSITQAICSTFLHDWKRMGLSVQNLFSQYKSSETWMWFDLQSLLDCVIILKLAWWQNHQLNRHRISPSITRTSLHCLARTIRMPRWTTMKANP